MGILPWYTTREEVKEALDFKETARRNNQIDRTIEASSRAVDTAMRRVFYPSTATRYFPLPDMRSPTSWRLWLDRNELISVTTLTSGGTAIAAADYFLEPVNSGPPYNRIEIDLASNASFEVGDTHQRNVSVVGVFGYDNNTTPAGTLAEALDASETGVDVTDSGIIGIGDMITVGTERMIVTGKSLLDTTCNMTDTMTASMADVTITVSNGALLVAGETITIDSEQMLVVSISGNTVTVKRMWDGSTLAAHATNPSDIYSPRTLTVERGSTGSTAAVHDTATAIVRQVYPGPVRTLCLAETINTLGNELSGYAREASSEAMRILTGKAGIEGLRTSVRAGYGRRFLSGAV
jgi:hypothetical protein